MDAVKPLVHPKKYMVAKEGKIQGRGLMCKIIRCLLLSFQWLKVCFMIYTYRKGKY